jgi:very-short-patch-repair endonuclease
MLSYNPKLKQLARINRSQQTNAEYILWQNILRNDKMGYRFLRQRPIGNFIVDFVSLKLKLVIEVDGDTHDSNMEYDTNRTIFLEENGFIVLRYTNEDVYSNLSSIYDDLVSRISSREKQLFKSILPSFRKGRD